MRRKLSEFLDDLFNLVRDLSTVLDSPPEVVDEAINVCFEFYEKGFIAKKSPEAVAAVCILLASRKLGYPLSIKTVVEKLEPNVPSKTFLRILAQARRELQLTTIGSRAEDYVPIIARRLVETRAAKGESIDSETVIKKALEILDKARKRAVTRLYSLNPVTLAATTVYFAMTDLGHKTSRNEIAKIANVSYYSVLNYAKILNSILTD